MDAEKVYYYIQLDNVLQLKLFLIEKSQDEVKIILEQIVNTIVWTKENYLRDGINCLHYAAKKGRTDLLKEMLHHEGIGKYRLNIDFPSYHLKWSPLHYAAYSGQVQMIKLLIRRLANLNSRAKDNKTPLHLAVQQGMGIAVAILVNNGADMDAPDDSGMTPLHYAVDKETLAMNECDPKHTREIVDFFVKKGANVSVSNKNGDTPLHCALEACLGIPIINLLAFKMKTNNTLNKENRLGLTPAHLCKTPESLQVLITAGACVNKPSADGRSLLHISSDNYHVTQFLLNKKADKSTKDKQGQIPLHSAISQMCPCLKTIKLLGSEYKLINAPDKNGNTPLHLACTREYKETQVKHSENGPSDPVLTYLIENGADLDAQNNSGQTPLHLAIKHKLFDKATLLISHGASLDIMDNLYVTPRKINPNWTRRELDRERISNPKPFMSAREDAKPKKHPLPKWVTTANIETDFNLEIPRSRDTLSRELTLLQDDVRDVKNFLEEITNEGGQNRDTKR